MDVSDGFIGDLIKMLRLEGLGTDVEIANVPLSSTRAATVIAVDPSPYLQQRSPAVTITKSSARSRRDACSAFEMAARDANIVVRSIGHVADDLDAVLVRGTDGTPLIVQAGRYDHFLADRARLPGA